MTFNDAHLPLDICYSRQYLVLNALKQIFCVYIYIVTNMLHNQLYCCQFEWYVYTLHVLFIIYFIYFTTSVICWNILMITVSVKFISIIGTFWLVFCSAGNSPRTSETSRTNSNRCFSERKSLLNGNRNNIITGINITNISYVQP